MHPLCVVQYLIYIYFFLILKNTKGMHHLKIINTSPEYIQKKGNYTGCFIMFSAITNIYNKKTKGPNLMELFTATGRLKKCFFFDNYRYSMCAPRVTRHTSIRYSNSCHTRVNMGASIFFTAAIIRAFRSARSCGNVGTNTLHEMHVAQ